MNAAGLGKLQLGDACDLMEPDCCCLCLESLDLVVGAEGWEGMESLLL